MQQRPDEWATRRGHAPEAREPAAAREVKRGALYEVVGGVRDRDQVCSGLSASALQEVVAQRARGGLHRTSRHRELTPLVDELDTEPAAQRGHVAGDAIRAVAQ